MGKGRTKRKRQAEKQAVNKQAHQARLERLEKRKSAPPRAPWPTGHGFDARTDRPRSHDHA
jgi:hypothetical protein